jgi:ribosome biogenesis GTPase / thiamine phosphate phosphatase
VSDTRAATATGTVLRSIGGIYDVETADGTVVETRLRGRLKLEQRTGDRVVAGDRVEIARQEDGAHTIEAVAPRATVLARRSPRTGQAKVLIANVDQLAVVFAAARPEPRRRLIDRFLVLAEANRIPALIIINKIDLVDPEAARSTFAPYQALGYDVIFTSVTVPATVEVLRERLCGRETVLAGPSGVGKSSLLNAIDPGLGLRIGAVSKAVGKGQHTTVSALLIPLACGGYVADTPGLRELGLWGIGKDELKDLFPELRNLSEDCRFGSGCSHTHEPDCRVQQAVAAGDIDRERYESYLAMLEDA